MLTPIYSRLTTPAGMMTYFPLFFSCGCRPMPPKWRIKDIAAFQNTQEVDLIGYGLVIGLDGTGDGNGTQFTIRSLTNMMNGWG